MTLPPLFHEPSPLGLWPDVLEMTSGLPSRTYQLLRQGDINAFCDVLDRARDTNSSRAEEIDG